MKNFNKTYIIILACILAAIVLLCGLVYVIFGALRQASFDVVSEKQQVISMQLQDKQVSDFKAKYPDYKANIDKASQLLVDAQNPVDFITFLENTASVTNVNADITVGATAKTTGVGTQKPITFQIDVTGDFKSLLQFFQQLEMSPYLVSATNMAIKKIDKDASGKNALPGDLEAFVSLEAVSK